MNASPRLFQSTVHVRRPSWGVAFAGLLIISILGFFLAPWSIETKSIAILHGLCAQRPSHSFWFGSDRLPFGSRMTGIYGGFLITQLYLLLRGRFRASGVPSLPVLSALFVFIVAMGLDGLNSTLDDVRLVTLYQPNNVLRYITGALTGTTLAVFLWLLTNNISWNVEDQRTDKIIGRFGEFAILAVPVAAFGLLAMSGWRAAYPFLAVFLVSAAILVMFELSICFLQLGRHLENHARSLSDLAGVAVGALLCAYLFMSVVAASRFLMEATMNIKQLQ